MSESILSNGLVIIIPVYNGEKFLEKTIDSCLNQTYKNIIIVIINDYSSDSSFKIIDKYKMFKNIIIIGNKKNMGINKSINLGVKSTKSKYLMFLGQDDILPPSYVDEIIKYFKNDTSFVYCNPYIINANGKITKRLKKQSDIKSNDELKFYMCMQNEIMATGLIMRRDLFISAGMYDEKYKNYGEWKLWIKLMNMGETINVNEPYSYYRRHKTNISNTFVSNQNLKIIKELHKYWNECRMYGLKSFNLKSKERVFVIYYMIYQYLKYRAEELKVLLKFKF